MSAAPEQDSPGGPGRYVVSGASTNPARSFGPDLVRGDFANYRRRRAGSAVLR